MKDAYYFSHDSNAKDDPKCVMLIEKLGLEGYGIYWVLVEILREQVEYNYPLKLIPALARRFNTSVENMSSVIQDFGLFETTEDGDGFFSPSLKRRMKKWNDYRMQQRANAQKRWGSNTKAEPTGCHGIATEFPTQNQAVPRKDKIEKEIIRNESKVDVCTEQALVPPVSSIFSLPLNDNTDYYITKQQIDEWAGLYPAVDILQELRSMRGWLNANTTRRKTKGGIPRFINGWLAKEQNKPRGDKNYGQKNSSCNRDVPKLSHLHEL